MRGWRLALALAAVLAVVAVAQDTSATLTRTTIVPNAPAAPTRTPKPDTKAAGYPFMSPQPACTAGTANSYRDANGCIYDCAGGKTTVRTRPLNNTCAYPTTGPTLTPTPTVTATP